MWSVFFKRNIFFIQHPVLAAAPDMPSLPTIIIFYKYFVSNFPSFMIDPHYKLPTSFHGISIKSPVSPFSVCISVLFNPHLLFSFNMVMISSFSLNHLSSLQLQTVPSYCQSHYLYILLNTYILSTSIYY